MSNGPHGRQACLTLALIRKAARRASRSYFQLSLIMSAIAFFRNIGGEATWDCALL
jgi:hypothetical protein